VNALVGLCVAFINGARVTIITTVERRTVILDLSSCRIAFVVKLGFASSSWDLETSDSHIFQAESITSTSGGFCSTISRDEFCNVLATLLSIAIVDGTFVSIFAVKWSIDDSFVCIARSDGAAIWVFDANRSVFAVSRCNIASFGCAFVVIVTSLLSMDTVSIDARIYSTFVSIAARNWSVNASRVRIARILGACIVVVTGDCNVLASSRFVARISGTCIAVIATLWGALASSVDAGFSGTCIAIVTAEDVLASSVNAFVKSTCIFVITIDWSTHASLSSNTNISGATIFVITKTVVWSVVATTAWNTGIDCASNSIVTVFLGGNESFGLIAGLEGTLIRILGCNCSVHTFSSSGVALIRSTCITVVTNYRSVGASCCCTSIDGTFVVITASIIVRGECAFSTLGIACINSTANAIITDFVGAKIC
jgi:hypothetical protein